MAELKLKIVLDEEQIQEIKDYIDECFKNIKIEKSVISPEEGILQWQQLN